MENEDDNDLGEMYMEGLTLLYEGNDADVKKAVELFLKASSKGHLPSKRTIGFMYLEGNGVERDLEKAYELISEVSVSMDPLSMYMLGRMYEGGLGVEQDDREALRMFASAAEMGIPEAEEDAERVSARVAEKRNRKLRSRPILNLEISDADIEAACCKKMFDAAIKGDIEVVDTYKGPELVREDEHGFEIICGECPFCGKKVKRVSKNKMY